MSDLFLSERLTANQMICVSELNTDALDCDGVYRNSDGGNLYLYLIDETPVTGGIHVLARLTSYESAVVLFDIFAKRLSNPANAA